MLIREDNGPDTMVRLQQPDISTTHLDQFVQK